MNPLKRISLALLAAAGGAGIVVQAASNAALRGAVGSPLLAVVISLVFSMLTVIVFLLCSPAQRRATTLSFGGPWYAWIGGLGAAFYLVISLLALPRIGATLMVASVVFGQMLAGLILDSRGWLGVPHSPINFHRILGFSLVVIGVILIQGNWKP